MFRNFSANSASSIFPALLRSLPGCHPVKIPSSFCDRCCRIHMVTRDHNRSDTRFPTFVNCCLYLRTHRIDHAAQSQKSKAPAPADPHPRFPAFSSRLSVRMPAHEVPDLPWTYLPAEPFSDILLSWAEAVHPQIKCTTGENHPAPLCKLNVIILAFMDCGHHFPSGIKRSLHHTGHSLFLKILILPDPVRPDNQGSLRRFTCHAAVCIQLCVTAQCHCCQSSCSSTPKESTTVI